MDDSSLARLDPPITNVRDRDQIVEVVSRAFSSHDLDVRRGSVLDASFQAAAVGDITVVWLAYGAPTQVDVTVPPELFHVVQIPLRGRLSVISGRDEVISDGATASLLDLQRPCTMRVDADCSRVMLGVDANVLRRHLESLIGHPTQAPIQFAPGMRLDSNAGRSWRALVELLTGEIQRDGSLLRYPQVSSQLESLVLSGLLTAQPNNYTEALRADQGAAPPRAISYALERIEADSNRALTTAQLALESGVSVRALQRGFQEHVGCSPMPYLRSIRLNRAREALMAADSSSGLSVTEVALEAGFMHLGRFAVEYRRKFGESPSQTLRR